MKGKPTCPKCGSPILHRVKQESYWKIEAMVRSPDGSGCSLQLGELDETYDTDGDYVCANDSGDCGDVVPLKEIIITSEEETTDE